MSQSTTLYVKFGDLELSYMLGSRTLANNVGLRLPEGEHHVEQTWTGEQAVDIISNEVFDYFRAFPLNDVLRAIITETESFMEMHRKTCADYQESYPDREPLPLWFTVRISLDN